MNSQNHSLQQLLWQQQQQQQAPNANGSSSLDITRRFLEAQLDSIQHQQQLQQNAAEILQLKAQKQEQEQRQHQQQQQAGHPLLNFAAGNNFGPALAAAAVASASNPSDLLQQSTALALSGLSVNDLAFANNCYNSSGASSSSFNLMNNLYQSAAFNAVAPVTASSQLQQQRQQNLLNSLSQRGGVGGSEQDVLDDLYKMLAGAAASGGAKASDSVTQAGVGGLSMGTPFSADPTASLMLMNNINAPSSSSGAGLLMDNSTTAAQLMLIQQQLAEDFNNNTSESSAVASLLGSQQQQQVEEQQALKNFSTFSLPNSSSSSLDPLAALLPFNLSNLSASNTATATTSDILNAENAANLWQISLPSNPVLPLKRSAMDVSLSNTATITPETTSATTTTAAATSNSVAAANSMGRVNTAANAKVVRGGKVADAKATSTKESGSNGLPLRALSAYNYFFRDERDRIVQGGEYEFTTAKKQQMLASHWFKDRSQKRRHRKTHGVIKFCDLSRVISQRWKELPEHQRTFYREVAEDDLRRYHRELDQYKMIEAQVAVSGSRSSKPNNEKGSSSPLPQDNDDDNTLAV